LTFDGSNSSPKPFSSHFLAAFIRQDEWNEAEVMIEKVPAGIYTVFWYFKLVEGSEYDGAANLGYTLDWRPNNSP